MSKLIRSMAMAAAALFGVVVLAIGATMSSAVSLAAKAFIVPGTGTPDANVVGGYLEQALDRYIAPFTPSCTNQADCDLEGIDYFASFWPFAFISGWCVPGRCEKWNVSVEDGRANLHTALEPYLGTDEDVVIFGYSQGAAVTSNEMRYLAENYDSDQFDNFSVVNIGSIDNRVGGAWTVLGFLDYIPILDVSTNLYNPISTGMPMTTINFQYDPVGSLPLYFNLLAVVNALIALDNVHGLYLAPNEGDPDGTLPYGYTDETLAEQLDCAKTNNCKIDEYGNVYITIPANGLPLTNAVRDLVNDLGLGWLVNPFIDLVEPAMQVLIDTAYAPEANPGDVRYLSLLPFNPNTNLLEFGNDLFRATVVGVEAFFDAIFDPSSSAANTSESEPSELSAPAAAAVESGESLASVIDINTASSGQEPSTESSTESAADSEPVTEEEVTEEEVTEEEVTEEEVTEDLAGDAANEAAIEEDAVEGVDVVEDAAGGVDEDAPEEVLEDGLQDEDSLEDQLDTTTDADVDDLGSDDIEGSEDTSDGADEATSDAGDDGADADAA